MKKFKFSLQQVLEIREKLKDEQQNKMALASVEYQKLIQKKNDAFSKISHARQKISVVDGKISIQQLKQLDVLQLQAEHLAFALEPKIQEKYKIFQQEQEKYNKLYQEYKALDLLKKQELKKYKDLLNKQDQMNMDEIAKSQFYRNHLE